MTVSTFLATVTLPGGADVRVTSGHVTLDETWAPYVQGSIRVPLASIPDVSAIDPRQIQRMTITAVQGTPAVTRTFDVGLRTRNIDHIAREVEIEFAGDEAILMDSVMSFGNPDPWAPRAGTLQDIIDWALAKVPSILRNLEPNPQALASGSAAAYGARNSATRSFGTTTSSPSAFPSNTIARFTAPADGTFALGVDSYGDLGATAPRTSGDWVAGPRVTPGETMTVSRWVRVGGMAVPFRVYVRFHDGAGNWVGNLTNGSDAASGTAGWSRPSWTGVVPAGARYMTIRAQSVTAQTITAGTFMDMTGLLTDKSGQVRAWRDTVLLPREGASGAVPMPAKWDATNLVINPKARVNVANWTAVSGCTIARAAVVGVDSAAGTGIVRVTQTATTGRVYAGATPAVTSVSRGQRHTASVWVKVPADATAYVGIQYFSQDDANRGVAEVAAVGTGAWQRLDVTSWVPLYTAKAVVSVRIMGVPSGTVWDIDQAMLVLEDKYAPEVPDRIPYFDGQSANTADYSTAWENGQNASPSIRTAVPGERPQSLYWWGDYKTLWEYLDPFLQEAGCRLWCDENREWRCDPVGDIRPGSSTVVAGTEGNMLDATEALSRDQDTWADGVIIRYRYVSLSGESRESFGSYSTVAANTLGARIVIIDREGRAYTGNGEARRVFEQMRGRGRVFRVSALGELTATPSTTVKVTLPGGEKLAGLVESVTLNLQNGVADINPRGMAVTT